MPVTGACGNCDGSGWHAWYPNLPDGTPAGLVWVACADCNDDEHKPKPALPPLPLRHAFE
jgi:hypothetical protein